MSLCVLLVLLQQLQLLVKVGTLDHFRRDRALVVAVRDRSKTASDRPDMLHGLKYAVVDTPGDLAEDVEHLAHRLKVCLHQVFEGRLEVGLNLCHLCLSKVEASEEEVLPWCWWIDHR